MLASLACCPRRAEELIWGRRCFSLISPGPLSSGSLYPSPVHALRHQSSARQVRIEGIQPGDTGMGALSAACECLGGPTRISDVLRVKGTQVITVTPDTTVRQLVAVLAEHRIGAVVVSHDGTAVEGIASERDVVQALARRGAAVMSDPVTAIYTAEVHTVMPQIPIEEVMRCIKDLGQ